MLLRIVIGFAIALVVGWAVLGTALLVLRPPGQSIRSTARVVPDGLRLVAALYRDRSLPTSVRWRLRVALLYNVQPINLIPDFIPVVGFADNAIVIIWALRGTVRAAGPAAIERHWEGTRAGLVLIYRAVGVELPRSPECSNETGDP